LDVTFDFLAHTLDIRTSDDRARTLPLAPRSVADFYDEYTAARRALGVAATIWPKPVEIVTAIPFPDDREHAAYDADAAQRHFRIVLSAARPSLVTIATRWFVKSRSIWNVRVPWGMGDVVRPRDVT
jgi:hypothetical protein